MEITMLWMYLFTRVNVLNKLSAISVAIITCFSIVAVIAFCVTLGGEENEKVVGFIKAVCLNKFFYVFFTVANMTFILLPTQKDIAAIYLVPKIINNEQVQELPVNALNLINTQFKAWIKDISPVGSDNGTPKNND